LIRETSNAKPAYRQAGVKRQIFNTSMQIFMIIMIDVDLS